MPTKRKAVKPKTQVVLALDVSSSTTGWAVVRSGRWRLSKTSCGQIKTPKLPMGAKLVWLRDALEQLIKKIKPTQIAVENIFRGKSIKTLILLARFNGVVIELSRRLLGKEPMLAQAISVRKYLQCGTKKEQAFSFICSKYHLDWRFDKNDITDAICLGLWACKNKDLI